MNLADRRTVDLRGRAGLDLLAIPLGATEQHGPHLPLGTDTAVAVEMCRRLAERVPNVIVAPALPYGSSGEHADFPGTLSIGREVLELVVLELVRSADHFAGVVLVNGHGGNLECLRAAVSTLRAEGRAVTVWSPRGPANDSHAGRTETSVMLRIEPAAVEIAAAEPGNCRSLTELLPTLRARGVAAVSGNGVLGDPRGATVEAGDISLDQWTDDLVRVVRRHAAQLGGRHKGVPLPGDLDTRATRPDHREADMDARTACADG